MAQYYQENKEEIAQHRQSRRKRTPGYGAQYYQDHREEVLERISQRNRELRDQAYRILGSECAGCGCCDLDMLVVDHIFGGGRLNRHELGGNIGMYREIIKNVESWKTYQLLCAVCNELKAYENGERQTVSDRPQHIKGHNLRLEIIQRLGPLCRNCGYCVDVRALHIDHIRGNGASELAAANRYMYRYYQYILDHLDTGDYMILCACCHLVKSFRPEAWKRINRTGDVLA